MTSLNNGLLLWLRSEARERVGIYCLTVFYLCSGFLNLFVLETKVNQNGKGFDYKENKPTDKTNK